VTVSRRLDLVGFGVVAALVLLYAAPVLGPGPFIAGDHPFYLAMAQAMDEALRARPGLGAWAGEQFGGVPVFSGFLPAPLGFVALSLARAVTGIPIEVLYKGLVLLSLALPAAAMWLVLSRRLGPGPALVGVNLFLLLTYHVVQPLQGMWMQYVGLGLVMLLVHLGDRWLGEHRPGGGAPAAARPGLARAAALGVLVTVTAATDAVAWPVLVIVVPLGLALYLPRPRGLAVAAGAALVLGGGLLVAAAAAAGGRWGIRAAADRMAPGDVLTGLPVWFLLPGKSRVLREEILPALRGGEPVGAVRGLLAVAVEHLPEIAVVVLGVAGVAAFWRGHGRAAAGSGEAPRVLGLASGLLVLAVLAVCGPWHLLGTAPAVAAAFDQRWFVPYANAALVLFATWSLWRWRPRRGAARAVAAVAVAAALVGMHAVRHATYGGDVALRTAADSVLHAELADVWAFVRRHVPPERGPVLYEELDGVAFLDGGATTLASLAPRASRVPAVVFQRPRTALSFRQPAVFAAENPFGSVAALTRLMGRIRAEHVVVWHLAVKQRLLDARAAEVVFESRHRLFAVMRLREGRPAAAGATS
jgi:hypothetical protein